jgi:LysM repeat protein
MGMRKFIDIAEKMIFVRKRFIFFVASLFLLPACFLKAHFQTVEVRPSSVVELIDDQYFFLHTVKSGQTLFSISRVYTITQELIIQHNPELEYGLKSDQVIRIPAFSHTVISGETEFGLSRKYGISIDQLRAYNPSLSDGLKLGQQLFLPGRSPDVTVYHDENGGVDTSKETPRLPVWPKDIGEQVLDPEHMPETLLVRDSLQRDSLIRSLYGSVRPCHQASPKETYHVALLIPLFLNELASNLNADSSLLDTSEGFSLSHKSFSFIPYYQGVLLALDSIQKQGVDIRLHVFDVDQNELKARQVVSTPGFSNMDLIIGPFFSNTLNYISNYALHNNINVVSPLLPNRQMLQEHPNLFNVVPSLEIQLENLAEYIGDKYHGKNIVFVHNNQPQALPVINGFRRSLSENLKNGQKNRAQVIQTDWRNEGSNNISTEEGNSNNDYTGFKEIIYNRVGISGLLSKLEQNNNNIIITLISGEAFLSNYLRELNIHSERYDIEVFGIPDWKDYESIEIDYLQKLNVHIFSPYFVDYSDQHIKDFIRRFRNEFKTEPSSDAFKAVSTAYYFFSALALYGSSFHECIGQLNNLPLDFPFQFKRPFGTDRGWENEFTTLFKFDNFRMVDVTKN